MVQVGAAAAVLATRMFQGRLHTRHGCRTMLSPPRSVINETAKAKLVDEYRINVVNIVLWICALKFFKTFAPARPRAATEPLDVDGFITPNLIQPIKVCRNIDRWIPIEIFSRLMQFNIILHLLTITIGTFLLFLNLMMFAVVEHCCSYYRMYPKCSNKITVLYVVVFKI